MNKSTNYNRHFSPKLRQEIVKSIDLGKLGVTDVSQLYGVSRSTVYSWLSRYSKHYKHQTRIVVEKKSSQNKLKQLEERLKELESVIGQKQMRIDYLETLIEVSTEELGIDIKKKDVPKASSGSAKRKKNIPGK